MDTKLDYKENTYLFRIVSKIKEISENEKGQFALFTNTIFFPQSGGQPSDKGTFSIDNRHWKVENVSISSDGVRHFFHGNCDLSPGTEIILELDFDVRMLHARSHTAGHLVDNIISLLPQYDLKAFKGYHFPQGSYIELAGTPPENKEVFISEIEEKLREAISANHSIVQEELPVEVLTKRGVGIPSHLSDAKHLRLVTIGSFPGILCYGTHIKSTSELGSVTIRKIKVKKGVTRISYQVS